MYRMSHFSDVVLHVTDNEGNDFIVKNTGTCEVNKKCEEVAADVAPEVERRDSEVVDEVQQEQNADDAGDEEQQEEENEEAKEKGEIDTGESEKSDEIVERTDTGSRAPVEYKQHAPRFFVVHSDGSGTELLRYQDIADYITAAEEDPSTAIVMDPLADYPGVVGLTVLKPYLKNPSDRWLVNYEQSSIIPPGLTSRDLKSLPAQEMKKDGPTFGTNVGQGLSIGSSARGRPPPIALTCPDKLELRQIIQFRPITEELRAK